MVDIQDLPIYYDTEEIESPPSFRSRAICAIGYTCALISGVSGGEAIGELVRGDNSLALIEGITAVTCQFGGQMTLRLAKMVESNHS